MGWKRHARGNELVFVFGLEERGTYETEICYGVVHEVEAVRSRVGISEDLDVISILACASTPIVEDSFCIGDRVCDKTEILYS